MNHDKLAADLYVDLLEACVGAGAIDLAITNAAADANRRADQFAAHRGDGDPTVAAAIFVRLCRPHVGRAGFDPEFTGHLIAQAYRRARLFGSAKATKPEVGLKEEAPRDDAPTATSQPTAARKPAKVGV